jgi:hypothetical protein
MGVTITGAANDGLGGSWLEGAGINGLSFKISRVSQPPVKTIAPVAIAEMTVIPKTFMRLFFTS